MTERSVKFETSPNELPPDGVGFTIPLLKGWVFVRYPIEISAPEGTIGFLGDGKTWQSAGEFKDGEWRPVRGQRFPTAPKYWTVIEGKE